MKIIDYESILCYEFSCTRHDLQHAITHDPEKDSIIDAMKEAVRQARENFENGEDE